MPITPERYTGPGLVDLQTNGYEGLDFNGDPAQWQAERFLAVASHLAARGVVASLITFITDDLKAILARARRYVELISAEPTLAQAFPRLHIEGPFISPITGPRGAHPERYCAVPAEHPEIIDRLQQAADGRIAILTVAPELPGCEGLIARATRAGIRVAIGHTNATPDDIRRAVDAGATLCTHLGNGSHQQLPRLDNYLQAQLADDRLTATFIADGHHIPFYTLKNFLRIKGLSRSVLVSDAMAAAGLGEGVYTLGYGQVQVRPDGRASIPGQDNLAGSTLTLDEAILNTAAHTDATFEQAWAMGSSRPAELIGLERPADITVAIEDGRFKRIDT